MSLVFSSSIIATCNIIYKNTQKFQEFCVVHNFFNYNDNLTLAGCPLYLEGAYRLILHYQFVHVDCLSLLVSGRFYFYLIVQTLDSHEPKCHIIRGNYTLFVCLFDCLN